MNEDVWLLVVVFVVWAVLALGYAFVPMFNMPAYAGVWGSGAAIFLALAVLIAVAIHSRPKHPKAPARHDEKA